MLWKCCRSALLLFSLFSDPLLMHIMDLDGREHDYLKVEYYQGGVKVKNLEQCVASRWWLPG